MSEMTAAQKEDLAEIMDAAGNWANELEEHIAPGSEEYGDEESAANQRATAEKIGKAIERMALVIEPRTCEWFHACERPAVTFIPHPILKTVPACQRCADLVEKNR